ncbi:hypothetical protein [Abyssogena phaseoliformis symbiont]|uniref:hypothetical protein n=1 Tax=Abyssogena phaseoliformis symbiont TaxID=596095 RepID=UPI001916A0B5|nr:hypothetical protein [Abyssogena phaseoliformis symbiont]
MEYLLSFLGNLPSILELVFVLANLLGIFFTVREIFSLTTNRDPRNRGDFIRMTMIGVLLTVFANIIDLASITFVNEVVSPKGEMGRYVQKAQNSHWKEAIISSVFAILILIGTWSVFKVLVKLSSSSSQRQEKDLKLIMSIIFSALLINLKWVLAVIKATFSFKFL